jgi:hypothetical protein
MNCQKGDLAVCAPFVLTASPPKKSKSCSLPPLLRKARRYERRQLSFCRYRIHGQRLASSNIVPPFGNAVCQSGEEVGVRQLPSEELREEEREAAAYRAGVAMQAWYSRYQATGDRIALSIAHRHMTQMVQILAKRVEGGIA